MAACSSSCNISWPVFKRKALTIHVILGGLLSEVAATLRSDENFQAATLQAATVKLLHFILFEHRDVFNKQCQRISPHKAHSSMTQGGLKRLTRWYSVGQVAAGRTSSCRAVGYGTSQGHRRG
ncbi:uncharacterized protein LOC121804125 [Salvia splendens]|uniref:uncharacterized protein LOC121804125 n=1 Tax=Salvia splendens TaxID=180675 RepID=UPI001C260D3E|nr:uncharacterized protein LOC121804125 [Salvia splendens]